MVAEEVIVELKAKISEYKEKLTEARTHFDKETGTMEARSKLFSERVRLHFGALQLFAYGAFAALPLVVGKAIDSALEYAGSLKEQAQQVGVTTKALQEYRYAGSQVGLSNETIEKGLGFLTRSFGQVEKGIKKPTQALHDLGFTVDEMSKLIQGGAEKALPLIADRISKITDPAERAQREIALFGRAGQQLEPLLAQGAAGIDSLRNAAERLGIVLSNEEIEKVHQAEIRYKAVKEVLQAQIAAAVGNNADAIIGLANACLRLVSALGKIPSAYAQAMAQISKVQLPIEQKILDFSKRFGGGNFIHPGQPTEFQKFLQGSIDADKKRIEQISPEYQLRHKTTLDDFPSKEDMIPQGTKDYAPTIAKALRAKNAQEKKGPVDRFDEAIQRIVEQESTLHERINSALADVAGTAEERAKAEKLNAGERETREHAQAEQEIASIQKSKEYTAAEKQSLILKIRSNEGLATQASDIEKQAIDLKEQDRLSNERTALLKSENQNSQDIYRAQEALTTDRKKRAEIEKALVDLAIEQERIDAEAVIHSRTASDGEKALAEERMKMLPQLKALNEAQVARQNQSPFQSYVTNLREGLANVNDTLEQLAVDQIKKLEDTLAGATAKALGLHGALGEIVTALIRIGIQQAELAAFGGGGAGGGGGIGSIFGAIGRLFGGGSGIGSARGSAFATDFSELGFAGGGRPPVNKASIIGEEGPELWVPDTAGTIIPNDRLGGASRVEVVVMANDYFDARVGQVTGPVIARASTQAARGGSQLAQQSLMRDTLHRLD